MNKLKERKTINILLCSPLFAGIFYFIINIIVLLIYYGNDQKNISDNILFNSITNISLIVFAIMNLIGLISGLIYMIKHKKILWLWIFNILLITFIIPFIK